MCNYFLLLLPVHKTKLQTKNKAMPKCPGAPIKQRVLNVGAGNLQPRNLIDALNDCEREAEQENTEPSDS